MELTEQPISESTAHHLLASAERGLFKTSLGLSLLLTACLLLTPGFVPAAEGQVRLSQGQAFSNVNVSPVATSERVFYVQDAEVDGEFALWSVPLDASELPTRLSSGMGGPDASVIEFDVSQDGQRAIYQARENHPFIYDVYSVPAIGGTRTRLSPDLGDPSSPGFNYTFQYYDVSPSADHITMVYFGPDIDEVFEGPSNGSEAMTQHVGADLLSYSPAESHVVLNLLSAGSKIQPIAPGFEPYEASRQLSRPSFSADGSWLVHTVDQAGTPHLARTQVGAGSSPEVLFSMEGRSITGPFIRNDGVVVYPISRDSLQGRDLFSIDLQANLLKISGDLAEDRTVGQWQVSDDGERVIFTADRELKDRFELYSVPIFGGAITRLSPDLPTTHNGDVSQFFVRGDRVVFLANLDSFTVNEYWSAPVAGGPPVRLSAPLEPGVSLRTFRDFVGDALVYYVFNNLERFTTAFLVSLEGPPATPVWVGAPNQGFGLEVDEARNHLIFRGMDAMSTNSRILVVDANQAAAPRFKEVLAPSAFPGQGVIRSLVTAPNGEMVFAANLETEDQFEVYRLPDVLFGFFEDGFETGDTSLWNP